MELLIGPAVVFGIVIALIEMHFVHEDDVGRAWIKHAWHAMPFAFAGVFINMNVPFVLELIGFAESFMTIIGLQAAVSVILMIKIHSAATIAGKVGEKWIHVFIIGILMFASYYIWDLFLEGIIGGYIPF